jgi:hypothetical protein
MGQQPQAQPAPPVIASPARAAAAEPSIDLRALQGTLSALSDESSRLVSALYNDAARQPELRSVLSDAMKINAAASVLVQRAMQWGDPRLLVADSQNFDRDWRVLSYRLGQSQDLSPDARQSLEKLNQYDRALCQGLGIQPQLNYLELFRLASELSANLSYLLEDMGTELERSDIRQQLLLEAGRVEQQARLLADAVSRQAPYDAIVAQFREFKNAWTPLATHLRPLENRYLERDSRRIWQVHRELRELLWLPQTFDPQQLTNLALVLKSNADTLFEAVTLNQLVDLPGARTVLPTAGEFYGTCEYFLDCVQRGQQPADLTRAYRDIEDSWGELSRALHAVPSPKVQQSLAEIERSLAVLRDAIGLRAPWDPQRAMQLAASLENLAGTLESGMKSRLMGPSGYLGSFRVEYLAAAGRLTQSARGFREGLVQGLKEDDLRRRAATLAAAWQQLSAYTAKLAQREKDFLAAYSVQITPALVEIQTMFPL